MKRAKKAGGQVATTDVVVAPIADMDQKDSQHVESPSVDDRVAGATLSTPESPTATRQPPEADTPVSPKRTPARAQGLAEDEDDEFAAPAKPRDPVLSVRLSAQLHHRLIYSAREEGISLESLVQELLAEGATLRAWEIIERKGAMRGVQPQGNSPGSQRQFSGHPSSQNGNQRSGGNRGPHGPNRPHQSGHQGHQGNHQGNRRPTSNAWMEDKAAFLEYVRNQEKRRR